MTVSIPLVALVGAGVYVAWRFMGLRVWQAILCLIFGFLLAATTAGPGNPQLHYRLRPMAHQAMNYPPDPRRWCPMPNTIPHTNINLQEVSTRNDNARHIVAGFASAMPALADIWRYIRDALNDTVALSAEITRLSAELRGHAA